MSIPTHEQTCLQLREHVAGLARVEGPRRDEQDEARVDVAMSGGHAGPLDHGKEIALHPFRARVGRPSLANVTDLMIQ